MTLKRKISLVAAVVLLGAALSAVFWHDPGAQFDATFVRYVGSDSVAIKIKNRSGRELEYMVSAISPWFESSRVAAKLPPGQVQEMTVRFQPMAHLVDQDRPASSLPLPTIEVSGVLLPSKIERLLEYGGLRRQKDAYQMSLQLPSP